MRHFPTAAAPHPCLCLVTLASSALAAAPALAQQRGVGVPIENVGSRARPEYDAVGLPFGGVTLFPEAAMSLNHDDNIFRTRSPKRADRFVAISPRMRLESGSQRYSVRLAADATIRRYDRTRSENSTQYGVGGSLAGEILGGTRIAASGGYARRLEPRGSSGDINIGGKPISYGLTTAAVTASRDVGRIAFQLDGDLARFAYRPADIGGIRIAQDFRDYRTTGGAVRLSYAAGPAIGLFVRGGIQRSSYPAARAIDRSSSDYSILGGVQFGLTNLVSGSIGVGYLKETFEDPRFATISGLDYDVSLSWSPTTLVTIGLSGERAVERSPFLGAAGGIQAVLSGTVEYEVLRPLILSAGTTYTRESFRGIARRDSRIEGQAGARYLVNRLLAVTGSMNYRHQRSSGLNARNYGGFGASIGLRLHR